MIFIANGADFSANNLGQIPLYSIEDVSQSTLDFLSHYSKSFSDEQKIAVHQMLTFLGYGTSDGIFSKITTIIFPFLSNSVAEAMTNAVDWSDITTRFAAGSKEYFSLEGIVLKNTDDTQNRNNIAFRTDSKSPTVPDASYGFFNSDTNTLLGNPTAIKIGFAKENLHLSIEHTVEGIPSYRGWDFNDNNVCMSVNTHNLIFSPNVTDTDLDDDESYERLLVAALQGKEIQYLRYNANKGASCIFAGGALTKEEIDTLYRAIKTCISVFSKA